MTSDKNRDRKRIHSFLIKKIREIAPIEVSPDFDRRLHEKLESLKKEESKKSSSHHDNKQSIGKSPEKGKSPPTRVVQLDESGFWEGLLFTSSQFPVMDSKKKNKFVDFQGDSYIKSDVILKDAGLMVKDSENPHRGDMNEIGRAVVYINSSLAKTPLHLKAAATSKRIKVENRSGGKLHIEANYTMDGMNVTLQVPRSLRNHFVLIELKPTHNH